MATKVLYSTQAEATGGRDGQARTLDGTFEVALATPAELGGAGGAGNNPEQLFAAGYAACFLGAMKAVSAATPGLSVPDEARVQSTVGIGPRDEGGFGLDVALQVSLPGLDDDVADKLVADAHAMCPYSNATRNNLDVRLSRI